MFPDPYDPQQLNRYSYTRNNPLKYTDPTGNFLVLGIPIGYWVAGALGTATVYNVTPQGQQANQSAIATVRKGAQNLVSQAKAVASNLLNKATTVLNKPNQPTNPQNNPPQRSIDPFKKVPDIIKNPQQKPGPDWEWRGKPGEPVGSDKGSWNNPKSGEQIHPDINHPAPKGPHYRYTPPGGKPGRDGIDINPKGRQINEKGEVIGEPIP